MHRYISQLTALITCLIWQVSCAFAQCPDSTELNITATLYTQENGLASNMITEMAKDSIGYRYFLGVNEKWIRYDGVSFSLKQYDKYSFVHYAFKTVSNETYKTEYEGSTVYKSGMDKNGITYEVGLNADSLTWINLRNNKHETFLLPDALRRQHWLQFFPTGENCWLTTLTSVYRFNVSSKKFINIDLPVRVKEKKATNETVAFLFGYNSFSFLLLGNMLLKVNDTSCSLEKFANFSQKIRTAPNPEIIMDHYLFIAGLTTTLYEVDLQKGSVDTIDISNYTGVKNTAALKITTLKNYRNYLLIGTSNAGLFIFNRCTHTMQSFQYEKQNADDLTNSVIWLQVDQENVIWMQTDAGLIKLEVNEQQMKTYMPSSVKYKSLCNDCNNVRCFYLRDKSNLLVATFGGIYNFNVDSEKFSNLISPVTRQPLWNDRPVSSVTSDRKGNIFIGGWTNEGILLLNSNKKKLINILPRGDNSNFSYNYLHCLFYDSHHVLWAGTREGFLRITNLDDFEKNDFKGNLNISNKFPRYSQSENTGTCFTITEDAKENIWMGTANGIYIYTITKQIQL